MITGNKNYLEITHFHPTGKPMPNGCHIQRGCYMQECRANRDAYKLDEAVYGGQNGNTKHKGGVVTLPSDITEERHDEVVDIVREVVMDVEDRLTIQRRFFELFKINTQERVVAYSVSHSFRGRYIGVDGESYDGESFSVEVNGLGSKWLAIFAKTLAQKLQKTVLVKDLNSNKILLVDPMTKKDLDSKTQLMDLMAFRKGLIRIGEDSVNHILRHGRHGFIIIPAKLRNKNEVEDGNLLKQLKKSKYAYTPVYRGCKCQDEVIDDFEPYYIVYCHGKGIDNDYFDFNDLYEFGLELVKKFKQGGFYVTKPNETTIYVDRDGGKGCFETPQQRFTADIQFESLYRSAGPSCYSDRIKRRQSGEVFV